MKNINYCMILAYDNKNGIGKKNKLPWSIKEDLEFFKKQTINQCVIMGYKTYLSIPENMRPLPDRRSIVLTNNLDHGVIVNREALKIKDVNSTSITALYNSLLLDGAIRGIKDKFEKAFFIGGASLFNNTTFREQCSQFYITTIDKDYKCDTFVQPFDFKKMKHTQLKERIIEGVYVSWDLYESKSHLVHL